MLLVAAFLTVALTPCPPRPEERGASGGARTAGEQHGPDCAMHATATFVTAACPCGCGQHAPLSGSSVRLGVALPSVSPARLAPLAPAYPPLPVPRLPGAFASAIDHVPLPA